MRFLGVGDNCDLASLYLRLRESGHDVRISVTNPYCEGTLAGMVDRTSDWRSELDWVGRSDDGIVLFENVAHGRGVVQDELRAAGYRVIGGSAFGDRLENDRYFAQGVLQSIGLPTARVKEFHDRAGALQFLDDNPGRYVLKFNGPTASVDNYVGQFDDGRDVRAFVARLPQTEAGEAFVLMDFVEGVEMGVGAYFNGNTFLRPACLDWEHKRFFPGDLGELTGEMGTVVTYQRTDRFFERTLLPLEGLLRENRYCGYINLNTIVNDQGIWPLEFTCRFGYPGFAILEPLQKTPWPELFRQMVGGAAGGFEVEFGFAVGLVLTTPPFPYTRAAVRDPIGLPIHFKGDLSGEDRRHIHLSEVGRDGGQLVTSGNYGWTMVITGTGSTIKAAQASALRLTERVVVPNLRYRRDIGEKLAAGDYARVERLGLLD